MDCFQESDQGLLYLADGFSPVLRWDGSTPAMELAGLDAPPTRVTLSGASSGENLGSYTAYQRFLDRFGFKSNLSPISNVYRRGAIAVVTGSITGATNASPIVITSLGHGLSTGDAVTIADVGGNTAANSSGGWFITVVDADSFSLDGSTGDGAYTSGGTWTSSSPASSSLSITYTSVNTTTDPKVTRRQILRNTDGQSDTYYVDVDTTDLVSTTFSSTKTDAVLAAQTSQAILDDLGQPLANRHDRPPNHKPFLMYVLSRMLYFGSVDYTRGHIKLTFGSQTVTGVGTDWTDALEGRELHILGVADVYTIGSVNEANQTLTMTIYTGATDLFALYAIRPAPAERRLVYYSEAGFPESVSPLNALSLPEDSDEVTGGFVRGSFAYITEKRHIWKLTFQSDPIKDGGLYPASDRGCINNRCWAKVDDAVFLLDEEGVHRFAGSREPEPVSDQIQDLFRPGATGPFAINWSAQQYFHCGHWRQQSVIRWFVCLEGAYLPKHALAYNYRTNRWWIEQYPVAIGAAEQGLVGKIPCVFLGCQGRQVHASWEGYLDVARSENGTVRGTVTSAGILSLDDSTASFSSTFAGSPVVIVSGTGKGLCRRIVAVTATSLTIDRPWLATLDTTSVYQVGGIAWQLRLSDFRLSVAEENAQRRTELVYTPQEIGVMDLRYFYDFSESAEVQKVTAQAAKTAGVGSVEGEADLRVDLTRTRGVARHDRPAHREESSEGARFVQLELAGVSTDEEFKLRQITLAGVAQPGQIDMGGGG